MKKENEKELELEFNKITGMCYQGIYKDKEIEIEFGDHANNTIVKIGGKQIDSIQEINVGVSVGEPVILKIVKFKEPSK